MNATTSSHEIITCRSSFAAVHAESALDAQGHAVHRLSSPKLVPGRTLAFLGEMKTRLAKACRIDAEHLQIAVQTTNADGAAAGRVYAGAVLLLDAQALKADANALGEARAFAAEFAELLANVPKKPGQGTGEIDQAVSHSARPALVVEDLAGCPLLGVRLPEALDIVIPGLRPIRLEGHVRRLPNRSFNSQMRTVRGRVRSIVIGGRAHRLFAVGEDTETRTRLRKEAIYFDESQRKTVVDAIATPGQQVVLAFVEETLDEGRAKPRIKRILKSITLVQASQRAQEVAQWLVA